MKYLIVLFTLTTIAAFAQEDPNLSTDGFTPFWNNPAATGAWNKFSVNATYRNEWPSIYGNFNSANFSAEYDLVSNKNHSEKMFNLPVGLNAMYQYSQSQKFVRVNVPIAVPFNIGESTVSVGLAPGIRRVATDWTQLPFGDPTSVANGSTFDLNAGLFWYTKKGYAGLSLTNITASTVDGFPTVRNFHAQAGYKFKLSQHCIFPMFSASYLPGCAKIQALTYFQFKEDLFSLGLGYTHRLDAYIVAAATASLKGVKIAYAYNLMASNFKAFTGAANHELRLSYSIPKLFN